MKNKPKTIFELILEKTSMEELNAFGKKHNVPKVFDSLYEINSDSISNYTLEPL